MADVNAKIGVSIDASAALAELKSLQRQLAAFHSSLSKGSAASVAAQKNLSTNLLNSINATGKFSAQMGLVRSSTESFTHSLEKNKLSMREYFRYAGGSTRTFGKLFKQEFNTIGKVAEERVKKMQTQYIKMGRDASGAIKAMSITPRTLDMNDYATKTALAAQKQALLNQLLKQGSTNLLNFGKNTQWAGRQLMVGFTIPLAYFGTAAAKTFMDLEKQAIKFKRVYGDMFTTTDETNKALGEIQKLAESFTKYGVAVTETMEMAASAAAMGKMGADLTAQVAEATRLAVLGGVEQAQALETTISVTNAFGIASEDLASKINFLNAVENQTILSIEDLTVAMPKAGPVVKQLGGSVEDLAFFMTAMKEGGINASEGANALKSGLASLINPSKKASEMLAGFGVNIKGIVEANQGDIKNTVIGFAQALDTLDPLNRARAIEQLFGKFQFSRLSTLFQNVTKEGTQANKVLQLTNASVEELAILAERELGTLENAIGVNFKESVEKLKLAIAPIGKTFLESVTPIVKVLGKLFEKFDGLGEGTKKFIVVASTLVGVIGPVLLMTFGLLANGIANIIKLFVTMRVGFLKAGSNTKVLADQTSYLNSEQLEAATVAASLDQAHNRLTQSFTVEAAAVKALRQAYIDATLAATNFARANPGMMAPGVAKKGGKPPKKYAKGVETVPGTGNADTVPAMLTPGEAVLPVSISQNPQYQPIIQGMFDGTLQAFAKGTTKVKKKSSSGPKPLSPTVQKELNDFLEKQYGPTSNATSEQKSAYSKNKDGWRSLVSNLNSSDGKISYQDKGNRLTLDALKEKIRYRMREIPGADGRMSNRSMTPTSVIRSFSASGGAGSWVKNALTKLGNESNMKSALKNRETRTVYKALVQAGVTDPKVLRQALKQQASHIAPVMIQNPDGSSVKLSSTDPRKWQNGKVLSDMGILNNYLNRTGGAKFQSEINKIITNPNSVSTLGLTPDKIGQIKKDLAFAKTGMHPTDLKQFESVVRLANFEKSVKKMLPRSLQNTSYQAAGVSALGNVRGQQFYKDVYKRVLDLSTRLGLKNPADILNNNSGIVAANTKETFKNSQSGKTSKIKASNSVAKNTKAVYTPGSADPRLVNIGRVKMPAADGGADGAKGSITPGPGQGGKKMIDDIRKAQQARYNKEDAALLAAMRGPDTSASPKSPSAKLKEFEQNMKVSAKELDSKINLQKEDNKIGKQSNEVKTKEVKLTKKQIKEMEKERQKKADLKNQRSMAVGRVAGPVAGVAGTAAMAGYMTGNTGMGNAMMGLSALAMAAQMVTGKFSAIVVGAALVATTIILLRKEFDKARKEAIEMNKATGASTEAIDKYAKFSNKVTASEIMDRRKSQKFALTQTAVGKTTFGGAFIKTEDGKALADSFAKELSSKNGNIQTSVQNLTSQLSASVLAGALTADQAKSIAVNLADELGNMSLGLQVSANLTELLGPDGKNILTNGIEVRAKMIQDQQDKVTNTAKAFSNNTFGNFASQKKVQVAGTAALAAGGAVGGAALGAKLGAATGSVVPGIGTAVGLVVGTAIGAGIGYAVQKRNSKISGALAGALVADMETALQVQSQLQDALVISFEKRIQEAKAAGDTAKAYELQLQYIKEKNALDAKGLELNTQIMDVYKNAGTGQEAILNGIKQDAKDVYKGTNEGKYVGSAQALLGNARKAGISREQEALINLQISSKTLKPSEVTNLLGMFEGKEKETKLVADILVNKPNLGTDVSTVLGLIKDKQGNANEQLKTEVLVAISAAKTDQEAQRIIDLVGAIGQFGGLLDADVAIDFYMKNKGLAEQFLTTWEELQSAKNITLDVVYDIDYRLKGQIDEEYFNTLKSDDDKKIYTKTISLIYNADVATVITGDDYKNWLVQNEDRIDANNKTYKYGGAEFSGKNLTSAQMVSEYANDLAKSAVTTGVIPPQTAPGATTVNTGGRKSTPFDSMLTDLKRTRDSRINAEGGAPELMRILGKNKDIKIFNGLDQQLAKAGANTDFIDWVGGLEKAIQNKLIKVAKDGTVTVTKLGEAAQKAFDEKQLGSFAAQQVNAIEGAKAQRTAFVKLTTAGMDQAQALELVADANFAVAISRAKDAKELKELIQLYQDAQVAIKGTARANDPIKAFRDDMDKINEMLDVQERQAKAKYQPEIDRVNGLIDANEKAIETKQRYSEITYDRPIQQRQSEITELNHDLSLIEKTASVITNKYDKQREALEQVYSINSKIADQQKAKISLADALTSGDISQAAQIVQDIRNQEQVYAKEQSLNALEIAQTNEINALRSAGGLSKLQIEEKIYTLGEEIYGLEQKQAIVAKEILALQDANYNLRVGELAKAQALLDNEIKLIEQQRLKYAEAELAIKSAEVKTNDYTEALKRSEAVLKRMATLWSSLGSKTSADLGAVTGAVEDPKDKGKDGQTGDKPPTKTNLINVTAKNGQTLSSIAKAYETTVKELLAINPVLTSNPKYNNGNTIFNGTTVKVPGKMYGGVVSGSGMLDKVPTMLTPGEFVMNRAASQKFGPLLERINESKYPGSLSLGGTPAMSMPSSNSVNSSNTSVYNYSLSVGVNGTSASPDDIARTVIAQIRNMDAQRLKGNRY